MQIGVSNPNVPIFPPRVCTLVLFIAYVIHIFMKSTKMQTLGAILLSLNVVTFGLKTPLHVLGACTYACMHHQCICIACIRCMYIRCMYTVMETEMYQSNIKIQNFIYRPLLQ